MQVSGWAGGFCGWQALISGISGLGLEKSGLDTSLTDVFEFARLGREAQGEEPIMRFERLVEGLGAQPETVVCWQVRGLCDAHGQLFLHVRARAAPAMVCQRCLQAVAVNVVADNRVQVVASEEQLNDSDDPEAPERIVGSNRYDLLGLVEDELILAMPYVPLHDTCTAPAGLPAESSGQVTDTVRPSPFAVLGQLKNTET